jgi:hypothetical protein
VERFEVKPGVEFPSEYLAKAQEEMFKQLSDAKIVKRSCAVEMHEETMRFRLFCCPER